VRDRPDKCVGDVVGDKGVPTWCVPSLLPLLWRLLWCSWWWWWWWWCSPEPPTPDADELLVLREGDEDAERADGRC
jgi:hypothetical protein